MSYTSTLDALNALTGGNTDASTLTSQATGNASLASINTKLNLDTLVTGSLTGTQTATFTTTGFGSITLQLSGTENLPLWFGSVDGTTNFFQISGCDLIALDGQVPVQAMHSNWNHPFQFNVSGIRAFRLGDGSAITGTLNYAICGSANAGVVTQVQSIGFSAQSGTWNITNVSGTVSLPTGAATAARQDTGNTSVASIDTKLSTTNTSLSTLDTDLKASQPRKLQDGAGTNITSQASGTQRALDVGVNVAGAQIDPRSIRALTSADIVTVAASSNVIGHVINDASSAVIGHVISDSGSVTNATLSAETTKVIGTVNQGGAWTVQPGNTANTTAWKVDGSAVTQPVSGTVTNNVNYSTRTDTFTATGNGTSVNVSTTPMKSFSVFVTSTGTVTSWDVRLEGSLDGTNFTQILQHTNVNPGNNVIVFSGSALAPCLYFRSRAAGLVLGLGTNVIATILGTT